MNKSSISRCLLKTWRLYHRDLEFLRVINPSTQFWAYYNDRLVEIIQQSLRCAIRKTEIAWITKQKKSAN